MDAYTLPTLAPQDMRSDPGLRVIDVRRRAAAQASGRIIAGAVWIDPETLRLDHPAFSSGPLAFYCAHGHELSAFATAMALVAKCDARMVTGGFDALVEAGASTLPFQPGDPE